MKNKIFCFLFVFVCLPAFGQAYRAYDGDKFGMVSSVWKGHQLLILHGTLEVSDDEIVDISKKLLYGFSPKNETIFMVPNFNGGYIDSINKLIEVLKDKVCENGKPCDLITYLPEKTQCDSSCIIAFMSAPKRVTCEDVAFGFHSISKIIGAQRVLSDPSESLRDLQIIGVNASWTDAHVDMFKQFKPTFLFPKDLEGANIITDTDHDCNLIPTLFPNFFNH